MPIRNLTLAAMLAAAALFFGSGQRPPSGSPPQLTIEQVKPGLYAILNPGANTPAS